MKRAEKELARQLLKGGWHPAKVARALMRKRGRDNHYKVRD